MHRSRPRATHVRLVISVVLVLAVPISVGVPTPALAVPAAAMAPGLGAWLGEQLTRDPAGQTSGDPALYYRHHVLDQDLTLALSGRVEDHWLQDYRRFGIGTALRSGRFELGTSVFDDVPGERGARGAGAGRRLDGYGIVVGARVPEVPWAWVRVKKQWRIPVDGEHVGGSDRLSLQIGPLAPLEIETGTTGDGEHRSWFAQLRFRIEFGGG
jgi:hypothetical protein